MRLRSQGKKQQQQQHLQQQQQHGLHGLNKARAADLPLELMHMLASRLSIEDIAAASLTCQAWAKLLRSDITSVTLAVGSVPSPPAPEGASMEVLARHCSVSSLEVLLNSRSEYSHTGEVLSRLPKLPMLKHLQLRFLLSNTPKKGSWPMFFSDGMDASNVETLVVEAPSMPSIALKNLLRTLSAANGEQPVLRSLDLQLGQPPAGSQLPTYASPTWLIETTARTTMLDGDHLSQVAKIASLRSLRCTFNNADAGVGKAVQALSALTDLTELVLYGGHPSVFTARQLTTIMSLRRLSLNFRMLTPATLDACRTFDQLQDLELGVWANFTGPLLQLLENPPAALRGLTLTHLALQPTIITQLAGLTALTSLQLRSTTIIPLSLDLTPLRAMSALRRMTLQVDSPSDMMFVKFCPPPPPPKPARVLTGACESVGKRRKSSAAQQQRQQQQQQQEPADYTIGGDVSALTSAWPHLQQLHLAGLPPTAVSRTSWEGLSTLTSLTSLALQFAAPSSVAESLMFTEPPGVHMSPEGRLPIVRLEHLPASVQELQLLKCYVGVPAAGCMRAGDALTSLSLAQCYMGSIEKGAKALHILQDNSSLPATADGSPNPLLRLLQLTQGLRRLELINLPWLTNTLLATAAGQSQLRGLSSLSVIGVGLQELTHGALLGLTGLKKLRELRWHVGDVLALMPDVTALAQLKGLMTLHIPNWLHSQMERWGGYAVLNDMPMCDVNVELP